MQLNRREFLALVAAGAVATACSDDGDTEGGSGTTATAPTAPSTTPPPELATDPFTLGVASGDPLADSVILWTRLAPEPVTGGGMPDQDVDVVWEVATDESFSTIVATGVATAVPALAHSVHVDASGLDADTAYHYRFRVGTHTSPVGRTRTAPAPDSLPASGRLRLGLASCQEYQNGYFTPYASAAGADLDLLAFLGDYIYEYGTLQDVREHGTPEVLTLQDYRNRYALYKTDTDLQAAHAACPWVVIWDDHEVANNYAGAIDQFNGPTDAFLERRAAAYQAFYEHLPLRVEPPQGPNLALYRDLAWGSLARLFLLDTRQHRDDQACGAPLDFGTCAEVDDPSRTMLGAEQLAWLLDGIETSEQTWTVIASGTVFMPLPLGPATNLDQWDGYPAERAVIVEALAAQPERNPVFVSGDIHAFAAGDVPRDPADPAGASVAAEFVTTSITSEFGGETLAAIADEAMSAQPNVVFDDPRAHGYAVVELTPDGCTTVFEAVSTIESTDAEISTLATFTVEAGTPGIATVS
ncbi:MAG: alkaline phosphatase D family protein [Acidimicrobiales bacterium]|jgi:alkaline phosphatase D|nr:alkaline phosphatase D family protein [Acidimicrobiales bacterium]